MKNKLPLVSVLMPVYNGSRFMGKAINSIIHQTYPRLELLVIDDGSTDTTWKILKKYQKKYPNKIKLSRTHKNNGAFAATNILFSKAKGTYLAPMDSDDISHPERITKEVAFLESHPTVILVGSNAKIIDADDRVTGVKVYPSDHANIYRAFAKVNPIIHPSSMLRRSLLPKRNYLYRTGFSVNSDYYTLFELLKYGEFANIPEFLLHYRIHGHNSSLQNLKARFWTINTIRLKAIKKLKYNFPPEAVPAVAMQYVAATLLPNSVLLPMYLYARGMWKIDKKFLNKIRVRLSMPAIIRYAFSFFLY